MLSRHLFTTAVVTVILASHSQAFAQFYNGGCSSCAPPAVTSCTPIQPVQAACYQTVPVTTYKREKQTVEVPFYKTTFENRDVTVYEPVTRQRTVEVPTVSYQTVTENRTVNRDMGRWVTNYQPIQKCAPCQVDSRPGMIGWLNRTGYSFRSAFVPNYRTTRQYVPQMMACNVPTTRQVAVRGTRKVVVNETQMVARKTTERVEVKQLAWRKEEVTVMRPSVAYRTVPIGSTLAYGYGGSSLAYGGYGYGGSSVAFVEDDDEDSRTARRPEADPGFSQPTKTAQEPFDNDLGTGSGDGSFNRADSDNTGGFRRSSYENTLPPARSDSLRKPPATFPVDQNTPPGFEPSTRRELDSRAVPASYSQASRRPASRGWKTSRQTGATRTAATDKLASEVSLTDRN